MTKRQKFLSALGRFFKNVFTKNIPLKIIALVFALLLWGYVLSEVKPKYVKRVYDVEITLQNEDRLRQKGWVVVDSETHSTDVDVEASIDRHSMIDASRIKCYVDLEKIPISDQDPDRKTVRLDVSTSIPEYAALKSVTVEQIDLTIERTWTGEEMVATVRTENALPAIVQVGNSLPEYFECIPPKRVTIPALSGLKSDIDRISRAEVKIDLSTFENADLSTLPGTYALTLPVEFFDINGEQIDSASTRDVKVTVKDIEIRRYKEVPLELGDVVADGLNTDLYEYECALAGGSDQTIRIYGDSTELLKVSAIKTEQIVLNHEEGEETLTVGLEIPSGVKTDKKESVTVKTTVRKRAADELEFEVPITYSGLANGLKMLDQPETVTVRVSGLVDAMEALNTRWFTASVDLQGCKEGANEVPVSIACKGVNLHLEEYRVVESDDGDAKVLITFVGRDGMTYLIELPQKTVTINMQAIETAG